MLQEHQRPKKQHRNENQTNIAISSSSSGFLNDIQLAIPSAAALLDMNPHTPEGSDKSAATAPTGGELSESGKVELSQQQQQLLQQQLQQQQLQLLQFQQQQLQNMSPSDLTAMAAIAHQMALGMMMMPMMPFMVPLNQGANGGNAANGEQQLESSNPNATTPSSLTEAATTPAELPHNAETFANQSASSPLALLGAQYALPSASNDDTPKRKRGRPPKKDVVARAKADAEKTLKQFPMWGYGVPMPLLAGFPGVLGPGASGAVGSEQTVPSTEEHVKDDDSDTGYDKSGRVRAGKAPPKKKARGTGKPRGRPRTRPRPGEIIHRAKPPAIAPANYSVLYNYSLSNLAQKTAELNGENTTTHEDNRLGALSASLLSADHE